MSALHEAAILEAWPKRPGMLAGAVWSAVMAAILLGIASIFAATLRSVFLFASLGPIVLELVDRPLARASSPRSMLLANCLALFIGYGMLALYGLRDDPSIIQEGVTLLRIGAVLSGVAILGFLLIVLHAVNPPSGATMLLVSLGFVRDPVHLVYMFAMVVLLVVCAWLVNRLAGIPVPIWSAKEPSPYEQARQVMEREPPPLDRPPPVRPAGLREREQHAR